MGLAKTTPEDATDEVGSLPQTDLASPSRTQRPPLGSRKPWPAPLHMPSAPGWLSTTIPSYEDNSLRLRHS